MTIFDKDLINTLLKIAQQTPNLNNDQIKNIAIKFVNNLNAEIDKPESTITSEKDGAELSPRYLESLSAFLNFLRFNGMSVGGNKIVLPHAPASGGAMQGGVEGDAEYASMSDSEKSQYFKYPKVNDDNFQYYVNKNALIKYLEDLQMQSSENSPRGKVLRIYVKNLLQEIEKELGVSIAKSTATKNEDKVDDNMVFDNLPELLSFRNLGEKGNFPVKASDLKSQQTFFALLSKGIKGIQDDSGVIELKDFNKDEMCMAVNIVYARAYKLSNTVGDESSKTYVKLVDNLAKSMGCSAGSTSNQTNKKVNYQQVGDAKIDSSGEASFSDKMANLQLPLVRNELILDRIINYSESILKLKNLSDLHQIATNVRNNAFSIKNEFSVPDIALGTQNYENLDAKVRSDTTNVKSAAGLPQKMITMVDNVKSLLMSFYNKCLNSSAAKDKDYAEVLSDQVNNVYPNNISALNVLKNQENQVLARIRQQAGK